MGADRLNPLGTSWDFSINVIDNSHLVSQPCWEARLEFPGELEAGEP